MKESDFLIDLIMRKYNEQFGQKINPKTCTIKSITKRVNADRSYQVYTKRTDDFLRLNVHVKFGDTDTIYGYRLETDANTETGRLGDETFVSDAIIDRYYVQQGVYRFNTIADTEEPVTSYLLKEDGSPLLLENGMAFILESA